MNVHVLIPARLASTRLPDKALLDIHGAPMVVRVAQRVALLKNLASVVVATDHERIAQACAQHGIQSVMTSAAHPSGTDRLAQAAQLLNLPDADIVVNVQGDEPLIELQAITACAALLQAKPDCVMATAAHHDHSPANFANPNVVKVVLDGSNRALTFSRAPVPWNRDQSTGGAPALPYVKATNDAYGSDVTAYFLRHIGLYAYRVGFLRRYAQLTASPLEHIESLEQLRVLWHGERIAVHISAEAPARGVDTQEDLEAVRGVWAQKNA